MIRISKVDVPTTSFVDNAFPISYTIFYFTFPFRRIYTEILRDGISIFRREKRVWWFFGWVNVTVINIINKDTHYRIGCGRVSNE